MLVRDASRVSHPLSQGAVGVVWLAAFDQISVFIWLHQIRLTTILSPPLRVEVALIIRFGVVVSASIHPTSFTSTFSRHYMILCDPKMEPPALVQISTRSPWIALDP